MALDAISRDLRELSLNNSDLCTANLQGYIKDALAHLVDPKLKRKSFELIGKCMQLCPKQSKVLFIKALEDVAKNQVKDEPLKSILILCDAPHQLKKIIFDDPQFLCIYLLGILKESAPSCFLDKQMQSGFSYSILEENIFIAIKIAVHVLQNTGGSLLEAALNDNNHLGWESSWVESLTSILLSVIRCEVLQKETWSITGIALAHTVNAIPSLELSRSLAVYLMQMTAPTGPTLKCTDLELGPLVMSETYKGGAVSKLSQIAMVNGLLTICSPELLLGHVTLAHIDDPTSESFLIHSFNILFESCSATVDPQTKYYCFQVMNTWLDTISRVTVEKYHHWKEESRPLFQSNSNICKKLLDLVWDNREDMIEGVPKLVIGIFSKLLELHFAEKTALHGEFTSDELIQSVTEKLLEDPWYIRGKYTLLCELLRYINTSPILNIDASFPSTLCKCFGTSNLVSAVNECYKSFISSKKQPQCKHIEEWNMEKWKSVFAEDFMSMLVCNNVRSTENCALYFIPTTLQLIPDVFKVMKPVLCTELNKKYSYDEPGLHEWHKRRMNLCYGYCAVLKFSRKFGLASIRDVDLDLLQECLKHNNDDLRAEAISVLCHNNKTTEPISPDERSLILGFLHLNLNCASSSFRQALFMSIKILMARLRDSCTMLLRDFMKMQKKQKTINIQNAVPDTLTSSVDFVENIVSLSLRCLIPGASYQRKKTGLQLLYAVLETFSSPKDAVKRGRTAESLNNLTEWAYSIGKWKFICFRNLAILITCLQDQHDEIRELALDISKLFPFSAIDMNPTNINEFGRDLMSQALALLSSPRIRDAESGAILFEFFCKRFLSWENCSIFTIQSFEKRDCMTCFGSLSFDGIVHVIFCLLQDTETQIQKSYNDVLDAALKQPVFGFIMATRRCFSNFVRHLSSHGRLLEGIEKYLGTFRRLVETSVKVCKTATEMALSVFANHEKPLGGSPSFAEMKEALENKIRQCKSFKSLDDTIGYQHCLELVSSFCWLNIKAATLFLGEIGSVLTLDCMQLSEKNEIFSDNTLSDIGRIFRETLINCRHKGVIENSCVGFQKLCKAVSTIPSKAALLDDWLRGIVSAVARSDINSSITKRSAGLPMFVQPIIAACIKNQRFQFQTYMESLIAVAKRSISPSVKEQSDLPQVQAMNILKAIYRDSSTGTEVLRYAADGLMLSIEGFTSNSWSIRNAAQILLGALIPRMLGQRITQADKAHHNSLTASRFFKMYPKLSDFFVKILNNGVTYEGRLTHMPGLLPVLTILSKLRPCEDEDIQSRFYPVLQDLMSCPVYTIRKLAAFSLALFMPVTIIIPMLKSWTAAHSRQADHNFNHGFLLMAKHLLEIKLDDATFAKATSIDIFLQISTAVLRIDKQPLLYCTLLEIYQTLIQSLYKSNSKENLIHRGCVRDGMMEITHKVNRNNLFENGLFLGAKLVPKRLAQASLSLIIKEQSINADFADTLMTSLLASPNELVVSETAAAISHCIEDGKTLNQELRRKIFDATCNRVKFLDNQTENLNVMECCFNAFDAHKSGITLQKISEFLQDSRTLCFEKSSHRQLAVILPYSGLMFGYYFRMNSNLPKYSKDFLKLADAWSEKLYACSCAGEREILRRSSLKAIQISAGSLFQYYEETMVDDVLFRGDVVAVLCSRFIMALLNLIQDEDETIRNAACDAVATMDYFPGADLPSKIHSNWALVSIFEFISNKMMRNQSLVKSLYKQLKELLETQFHLISDSRAALLFEQESANLFAEDFIFAEQIMLCLQKYKKRGCLHLDILPTGSRVLAKELASKFRKAIDGLADMGPDTENNACFGNQVAVMALNLLLRFLLLIDDVLSDKDTDIIANFLWKAKLRKDLHPFLQEQIDRTLTDLQYKFSLQ